MKTKHTPGPWTFKPSGHLQEFTGFIERDNRKPHETTLAAIMHNGPRGGEANEEDRANARLIAAAPELLAFAQWAIAQFQGESGAGETYWEQFAEYRNARAAIARATGADQSKIENPKSKI